MQQQLEQEQDVLTYLLTTLVGGALDEEGEQMLADVFDITTANLNQLTPQGWADRRSGNPSKMVSGSHHRNQREVQATH